MFEASPAFKNKTILHQSSFMEDLPERSQESFDDTPSSRPSLQSIDKSNKNLFSSNIKRTNENFFSMTASPRKEGKPLLDDNYPMSTLPEDDEVASTDGIPQVKEENEIAKIMKDSLRSMRNNFSMQENSPFDLVNPDVKSKSFADKNHGLLKKDSNNTDQPSADRRDSMLSGPKVL